MEEVVSNLEDGDTVELINGLVEEENETEEVLPDNCEEELSV